MIRLKKKKKKRLFFCILTALVLCFWKGKLALKKKNNFSPLFSGIESRQFGYLSLHCDIPQISGFVASRLKGSEVNLWTCGSSSLFEGNKKTQGHRFPPHWPSIVERLERWHGGQRWCCVLWGDGGGLQHLTWSQKRKQTYALFQRALNHEGQLVAFQFIKWIWTFALWSRLVSTDVTSPHPPQTEATSQHRLSDPPKPALNRSDSHI